MIAKTPAPPYYAVIFTSVLTGKEQEAYDVMAHRMVELAQEQDGFLGIESARDRLGISVSYWRDLASIRAWKAHAEHQIAQETGKTDWYAAYHTRVCLVERDYRFETP